MSACLSERQLGQSRVGKRDTKRRNVRNLSGVEGEKNKVNES